MRGKLKVEVIKGQKSWKIENKNIRLYLTEFAAHMAPVTFFRDSGKPVEPFYINPWAEEENDLSDQPGVLKPLRGDFLCLPFGGDNAWQGEHHPPHGDVQEGDWRYESDSVADGRTEAVFSFDMRSRPGKVVKTIELREGENNIYLNDSIEGFAGPACPGHHAIFSGGSRKLISMGPDFVAGFTNHNSANGYGGAEYYSLANFKRFDSLKKVPTIWSDEPYTDCSVFPAREGFIDLLQNYVDNKADFAWTAVAVPEEGWLWFALKDPKVLPSTVLWMENRGRHMMPWNGRNSCIGVEDVCCFLGDGLRASAEDNELSRQGFKTAIMLDGEKPFDVRYIHGCVKIPSDFNRVSAVEKEAGGIRLVSENGMSVSVEVDLKFLTQ